MPDGALEASMTSLPFPFWDDDLSRPLSAQPQRVVPGRSQVELPDGQQEALASSPLPAPDPARMPLMAPPT